MLNYLKFDSQIFAIVLVLKGFPLAIFEVYHQLFQAGFSLKEYVQAILDMSDESLQIILIQIVPKRYHDKVLTGVNTLSCSWNSWLRLVVNG